MTSDHSLDIRRAIVTELKADAAIASQVGTRVYGDEVPAKIEWPFIRVGQIIAGPYDATCLEGTEATFAVNTFAIGDTATMTLNGFIEDHLDGAAPSIGAGAHTVSLDWTNTQIVRDTAEADKFHGIVQFEIQTSKNY